MHKYIFIIAVLLISAGLLTAQYTVGFEGAGETKTSYASGNVSLSGISWNLNEVLIGDLAADWKNGARSARLRGYGTSAMTMLADKTGGIGTVTFMYRRYGTDAQVDWKVEYSSNGGSSWTQIGPAFTASSSDTPQSFSFTLNLSGNLRIRIKRATETGASNNRLNIDDIILTDYSAPPPELTLSDYILSGFTYEQGSGPSLPQTYTVSGQNLFPTAGNISVSAASEFEFSLDAVSFSSMLQLPYSGSELNTTVYVRMGSGLNAGSYNQIATHSGGGTEAAGLSLSGIVTQPVILASDLFFSEYLEGSSNNKVIEIFNGTGAPVDLGNYRLELYSNGAASPSNSLVLSGNLSNEDVYVVAHPSANSSILALADLTSSTVINFNGDDALALKKISSGAFVDIFGVMGNDPGTAWTADGGYSTLDKTLVRKPGVITGITQNPAGTGPTAFVTLGTEWDVFPIDTVSNLGTHTFEPGGQQVSTPTVQASNLQFYPGTNSISLEWTPGNGARRVVKINTQNSFTNPPNGSDPTAGTSYPGSGEQVIYNGSTQLLEGLPFDGVTVTSLNPSTTYWFRIWEYNGSGSATLYLSIPATGNPGSCQTGNSQYSGYYQDISGLGSELKTNLHTLIRSTHHTEYSYTATTDQLRYTDADPANPNNVIEIYTGWSVPASSYGGGTTDWNKEHTWSKSHGDFGDNAPAGTDLHHLRPCDATVNSTKNNKDFDAGGTAVSDSSPPSGYSSATGCYQTSDTWEPRDADKGDVARIIMYMAVRYEGTDTDYDLEIVDYTDTAPDYEPYYGKLATLLNWHVQDPPDARERQRNERIFERQGNRNPFIDYPSFAQEIWSPVPLSPSNVTQTGFTANWSAPISATKYYLQVATDSLFTSFVSGYSNYDAQLATSKTISGLSNANVYYYRLRSYFLSGYSMYSPWMAVQLYVPSGTAALTALGSVYEYYLNGSQIQITLSGTGFSDSSLNLANFSLQNHPDGLSIQSVQYLNASNAILTLSFNGADFDLNHLISVTVSASELLQPTPITSTTLKLYAYVETLVSIGIYSEALRLDISEISGAASYQVFAAPEPYGQYTDVSSEGSFDPLIPTRWTQSQPLVQRRFYKAAGIRP